MKYYYKIALLIVLAINGSLQAQDADVSSSGLSFGARVGAVVSEFSNGQPHTSSRLGYSVGGFVEYSFSPAFSVMTEPAYFQQGGTFVRFSDESRFGSSGTISSLYTTENSIKLHGIDLPILAKLKLNVGEGFNPHFVIGGAATYNFFAENNFERTYYYNQTFSTIDGYEVVSSDFETFSYSIVGGIGTSFIAGSKTISLDVRYKYGITPVKKGYSYIDIFTVQEDLYSNSLYFSVGVGF